MISPEPYELSYIADIKRLLGQIRVSNGFLTDAGVNVFTADERLDPDESSDINLIVTDPEEQLVSQDGYLRDVNLRVEVESFVKVGSDPDGREKARIVARKVLTDIRSAMLQGLKGNSFGIAPIDLKLDGRRLPVIDTGSQWQFGMQPVIIRTREAFQSV